GFSGDSCAIQWDNQIQISYDSCNHGAAQVLACGDTVHILWFGNIINGPYLGDTACLGILYSHSFNGGRTFSPQVKLEQWQGASGNPGVLALSGRNVYLVYTA